MKTLYEHAKSELHDVNETMKQQELQRDAYLTQFDEKWTFTDAIRKQFHKQSEMNNKIKGDAKEWTRKLEELQKYDKSDEAWTQLREEIWKFGKLRISEVVYFDVFFEWINVRMLRCFGGNSGGCWEIFGENVSKI